MTEPKTPEQVLAGQLRYWRDRRKLSAQGLADRIEALGGTLSRVAISKIENHDRGVTLDEWLQLAHALAVPPPLLFLDLQSGENVQIAPEVVIHPWLAWEWVAGEIPPVMSNRGAVRVEEFGHSRRTIRLYRQERQAADKVHTAGHKIASAEYAKDDEALRVARTTRADALRGLADVLDQMIEHDMHPPGLPRDWVETMRTLKLLKYPDRVVIFGEPEQEDGAG